MGVYLKRNNWYMDYYFDGRRHREMVGPNKKVAQDALRKRKVEISEKRFLNKKDDKKITFETLTTDYLNYSKLNKRSAWRDEYAIKNLAVLFNSRHLDEITPQLVERYKSERIKQVQEATVNKEVATLKCMLNRAVDWGMVETNPVSKVKLFRVNNKRLRFLEKEELVKLLNSSSSYMRSIIVLALNTGMRRSEIKNLKWKDIDFKNKCICISEQKNGDKSFQPINEHVIQALLSLKKHPTSQYVFCTEDGRAHNFRTPFETTVRRAGIVDFHFHDLRHTYASYLAMAGVDLNTVMRLMRHKSYSMTLRYAHLSNSHMNQAVTTLASHLDTLKTPATLLDLQAQKALLVSPSGS